MYIKSIILGVVQGLTEFLPISSSGHLILFRQILKFNLTDNLAFDASLHLGSLFALILFFKDEIFGYCKNRGGQRMVWLVLIAALPAGFFGLFFENLIAVRFFSATSISLALIIGGILFIIFEKFSPQESSLEKLTFKSAAIIGLAQILAFIPGVSRSGITIIAGLGRKLNRESAAKFSFLLAIPIIFAAAVKKICDLSFEPLNFNEIMIFILGFFSALISGYFCVKYSLRYLRNYSLIPFAVYRFLLALLIIIYLIC